MALRKLRKRKVTGWRRISTAVWGAPSDPQVYGDQEVDATNILRLIEEIRATTGEHVTVTHVVGKAVAYALGQHPQVNEHLRRGSFIERETIDIFFLVSSEEGEELTGVKVERCDQKAIFEIAREVRESSAAIRSGDDALFGKTKSMLEKTPLPLMRLMMRFAAWVATDHELDLPRLGLPRDPFGSAMITSVGMFGIQHAYAPLSPLYRVPFLVLVSEVVKKPVVVDDEIVIRPILTVSATLDHRYVDGYHAGKLVAPMREYLVDPKRYESA